MPEDSDILTIERGDNPGNRPLVSICIPVFNEEKHLERTITSVLSQTYDNFELVISDNVSTDKTEAICRKFSEKDKRLKYFRNSQKVNQNENFNCVFRLSKGELTLWMGGHDWLDANYIEQCVTEFEKNPDYVMVTTYAKHIDDEGVEHYKEYKGTRLDLKSPCKRFSRMLWFLTASHLYIGPVFSMARRNAVEKTGLFRHMLYGDLIFALQMSLLGPWGHVPKCLQFRKHPTFRKPRANIEVYGFKQRPYFCRIRMCLAVVKIVWTEGSLRLYEKLCCTCGLVKYYFVIQSQRGKRGFKKLSRIIGR